MRSFAFRSGLVGTVLLFAVGCGGGGKGDGATGGAGGTSGAGGSSGAAGAGGTTAGGEYEATIRWTSHGIPHITGSDLANVGFGAAIAEARFNICIIADQIVRVRSERSMYFGPGPDDDNITQDFGMFAGQVYEVGREGLNAISPELRDGIAGYVAGYNQYLEETGVDNLPSQCAGAEWVKPITSEDLFAYYYLLALSASIEPFIDFVADAQPPGAQKNLPPPQRSQPFPSLGDSQLGSNGWAIGKDMSESGNAMVLSNPHFPWEGNRRFWEKHLTIPGDTDVYGVSLVGVPIVNIGFNDHVAWTHTVTSARHFTLYSLDLVPGDPTKYLYDGAERQMTSREESIQVKQADGSLAEMKRTFWRSHYGPMVNIDLLGGWTDAVGYSIRDANERNFAIADQFLAMNRATSVADLVDMSTRIHGLPWVNTMAADDQGNALYMDASRTPNLSAAALADLNDALANDFLTQAVDSNGATLLNGSDSKNEWVDDGAAAPGIVSIARSPVLERTDYVGNANDSHWLSNASAPLEGFSVLFGKERTPRSPRTRMNLMMLTESGAGTTTGSDGKFSFEELQAIQFNNRASISELLQDQVAARCAGVAMVDVGGQMVDVGPACAAITSWDGRLDLESVGAIVWREFLQGFRGEVADAGTLFSVAFDADDPVATPNTLAPAPAVDPDPVLVALGQAVLNIQAAGLTVTAALGDAQNAPRGGEKIPIHGGSGLEGAFNIVGFGNSTGTLLPKTERSQTVSTSGLSADGYVISVGASTMMITELTPDGPEAVSVVSYSQGPDPDSEFHIDQTRLFSQEMRRPVLFKDADIAADPNFREETVTGPKAP